MSPACFKGRDSVSLVIYDRVGSLQPLFHVGCGTCLCAGPVTCLLRFGRLIRRHRIRAVFVRSLEYRSARDSTGPAASVAGSTADVPSTGAKSGPLSPHSRKYGATKDSSGLVAQSATAFSLPLMLPNTEGTCS